MNTHALLHRFAGWSRSGAARLSLIATLALPLPLAAAEGTLSEMLELGIYSEETKGDLPAAMKLYEQILAESAADRSLAAQALFRLALCHDKQGDYAKATASFEQLVSTYADQKELVSLANEYLAAGAMLLPAPWVDGEEMQLDVRLPGGDKIGAGRYLARAGQRDGRKVWVFLSELLAGGRQWSRIEVDADTFKPLFCQWKITGLGETVTTYTETGADVRTVGKEGVKHVELPGVIYDNEQAAQLMRRLPLAVGYKTTMRVFTSLGGYSILPVPLRVTGIEKVMVPAGEMECFRVELKVGPNEQVFWYSNDKHRYLVKIEAGGARIELARVVTVPADAPIVYHDEAQDFSVTAPADWMITRRQPPTETATSTLIVLDPKATAMTYIEVKNLDQVDEAARTSARAWAEEQITKGRKHLKSFDVRADSWREFTIQGHAAVSFTADIVQTNTPEVMHAVYFLAGDRAVAGWFATDAARLDSHLPLFEDLVRSIELN